MVGYDYTEMMDIV